MSGKDRENLHHRFRAGASPTGARATVGKSRTDRLTVSRSLDSTCSLGPLNDGQWIASLVKVKSHHHRGNRCNNLPNLLKPNRRWPDGPGCRGRSGTGDEGISAWIGFNRERSSRRAARSTSIGQRFLHPWQNRP